MSGGDGLLDLLVVGAGPTGIAVGAAAVRAGLRTLVLDQGPYCASLQAYPTDLTFFTTRERLEIADVPFTIPDVKPNRRQALVYYREVIRRHEVPLALYERVERVEHAGEGFAVRSVATDIRGDTDVAEPSPVSSPARPAPRRTRRARAVVFATGYFWNPCRLGVPGEELPWVRWRYVEPYPHLGQDVVVVGGANSAAKTALDLWRNGARVTLVHRRAELRRSIKYWIRPDLVNRIEEGSIGARLASRVVAFEEEADGRGVVVVEGADPASAGERERLPADAAYVLIGYRPDVSLLAGAGIEVDPESLVPVFDPDTCESNVPGLYVAGTVQAGRHTDKIFIENSRDHGAKIIRHLRHS